MRRPFPRGPDENVFEAPFWPLKFEIARCDLKKTLLRSKFVISYGTYELTICRGDACVALSRTGGIERTERQK